MLIIKENSKINNSKGWSGAFTESNHYPCFTLELTKHHFTSAASTLYKLATRFGSKLINNNLFVRQNGSIIFLTKCFYCKSGIFCHSFQKIIPFIGSFVFKFRICFNIYVINAIFIGSKKWSKIVFECLFITLWKSFLKLFKKAFWFCFELDNLIFDNLFSLKFFLDFGIKLPFNKDSSPCNSSCINIHSISIH